MKWVTRNGIAMMLTLLAGVLFAEVPHWWIERGVMDTNAIPNDYAPVNQGQVKYIAEQARQELNMYLPLGAGAAIDELIAGFNTNQNYTPANAGQLKFVAEPFYNRLVGVGFATGFPWDNSSNDVDYALANIGQLKNLFSFDLRADDDSDGLPNWWEARFFGSVTATDPDGDPDGDGVYNSGEYLWGRDPGNENDAPLETGIWESTPSPLTKTKYLARSGNMLFISKYTGTEIYAFDLSVPLAPVLISVTNFPVSGGYRLAAHEDCAYGYASRDGGLHVFDYSSPEVPQYTGLIELPEGTSRHPWQNSIKLIVEDEYLYIHDNSIEIYSLSNAVSPQWVGTIPDYPATSNRFDICGFHVEGDRLYSGYYTNGFGVWDISDRSQPVLEAFLPNTNTPVSFAVQGDYLYSHEFSREYGSTNNAGMSNNGGRVVVLNAPEGCPTNYVPLETFRMSDEFWAPANLWITQQWLYVGDGNLGFQVYDISDPAEPRQVAQPGYDFSEAEFFGAYMYLADGGLTVVDVSTPNAPEEVIKIFNVPASKHDELFGENETAYITRYHSVVELLDTSAPSNLDKTIHFPANGVHCTYVTNGVAYVARGEYGIGIYDLSQPSCPQRLAGSDTANTSACVAITVGGDFAYYAKTDSMPSQSATFSAVVTVNCSDLENPQEVYTNSFPEASEGMRTVKMTTDNNRLYVTSWKEGLRIFDLTDPAQPDLVGQYNSRSCFGDACAGGGNLIYAADGVNGLLVIDVSDPAHPERVAQLKVDYGRRLALQNDRICMIGYKSIYFIDVSSPLQPMLLQEIRLDGAEPTSVCATDGLFHVLDENSKLYTYLVR